MVELFGTDFAAEISAGFAGELEAGTLHAIAETKDAHHQTVRTPTDTAIEGTVLRWDEKTMAARGWAAETVKILMLAHDKPKPAEGDEITMRSVKYHVLAVEDGGAEAVWNIAGVVKP